MHRIHTVIIVLSLCLFAAPLSAETITHNFQSKSSTMAFSSGNTIGTILPDTTYTCSGTSAAFTPFGSPSRVCIGLPNKDNAVVLSPAIENLDSLRISYLPAADKTIDVYTSEDNSSWTKRTVTGTTNGLRYVKLPAVGNFYVKIVNPKTSNTFYITEIKYITNPSSGCNCFVVVSE